MEFAQLDLGPKMLACSERERRFVWHYVTGPDGNATEAARRAGYSDPGGGSAAIRVQAHQMMHRQRVLEAIEEVGRHEFRNLLVPALNAARSILSRPEHPDHVKTTLSVLARLGFGEKSGLDVNVTGSVTVNHTDEALSQLRMLKSVGAPHIMLVEMFGHSGLERYEKMLAVADAKLIEHQPETNE